MEAFLVVHYMRINCSFIRPLVFRATLANRSDCFCLYVPIFPVGVGDTAVADIVATTDEVAAIVVPTVVVILFTAESVVARVVLAVVVVVAGVVAGVVADVVLAALMVATVVVAIDGVVVDVTFPSVNKFSKHPKLIKH